MTPDDVFDWEVEPELSKARVAEMAAKKVLKAARTQVGNALVSLRESRQKVRFVSQLIDGEFDNLTRRGVSHLRSTDSEKRIEAFEADLEVLRTDVDKAARSVALMKRELAKAADGLARAMARVEVLRKEKRHAESKHRAESRRKEQQRADDVNTELWVSNRERKKKSEEDE